MLNFDGIKKILLLLMSSWILISCSIWDPDLTAGNGASDFVVADISFEGSNYITSNNLVQNYDAINKKSFDDWNLNYINNFTFKACLKEAVSKGNIKFKEFVVLSETGEEVDFATTAENGCFLWQEPYVFNILAQTFNLKLKRRIKGVGLYKGTYSFDIIVNPWAERNNKLKQSEQQAIIPAFDNREVQVEKLLTDIKDVSKALVGQYKFNSKKDGRLFLKKINYKLSQIILSKSDQPAKRLKLSNGNLYTRVKSLNGKYLQYPLNEGGVYSVNPRLVELSGTQVFFIKGLTQFFPEADEEVLSQTFGTLPKVFVNSSVEEGESTPFMQYTSRGSLELDIPVLYSQPKTANKTWVFIDVSPVNFPFANYLQKEQFVMAGEGHTSGEAVFKKENVHGFFHKKENLKGIVGYNKKNQSDSIYDLLMSPESSLYTISGLEIQSEIFIRDEVKPKYYGTIAGESLTVRGIRYTVKPCIRLQTSKDPLAQEEVRVTIYNQSVGSDVNFLVKKNNDKVIKKSFTDVTDHNGCVTINDDIWYRHFSPEKYLEFKVEVKQKGSDQVADVEYIINPWDEGWTFSLDKREADRTVLAENRDGIKIKSRLFLPKFSYETLRFKYNIDKYLNLNVLKQVLFNFSPTTLRYNSNRSGRFGVYHQRDGIYLLKVAMEKNYLDPSSKGIWLRSEEAVNYSTKDGQEKYYHPSAFMSCPENSSNKECYDKKDLYLSSVFGDKGEGNDSLYGQQKVRMKRHLDVVSRLVRVVSGQIITPVAFEVPDIRVMRLRSNLFVQIEPVDEWRLWMAKLYYKLYEDIFNTVHPGVVMPPELVLERQRNINKIIDILKKNPRLIHNSIYVKKYLNEREKKLNKNGDIENEADIEYGMYEDKRYKVCLSPENIPISWENIFTLFGFIEDKNVNDEDYISSGGFEYAKNIDFQGSDSHGLLRGLVPGGDIFSFVEKLPSQNNAFLNFKSDGTCLRVNNVIRDLIENDPKKMTLNPFNSLKNELVKNTLKKEIFSEINMDENDDIRLSDFIDKKSGLEQSTFFGPMTFLKNGNSSNMRPTSNISEHVCTTGDCDENKNEVDLVNNLQENSNRLELKKQLNTELLSIFSRGVLDQSETDDTDYRDDILDPASKRRGVSKEFTVYNKDSFNMMEKFNNELKNPVKGYKFDYIPTTRSVYDSSRYFGDLSYANNLLVYNYASDENKISDCSAGRRPLDLEGEMFCLKKVKRNENELRSKLFYYLNNFNLRFITLGDEKVKYFDPDIPGCESIANLKYSTFVNESKCFVESGNYQSPELKEKLLETNSMKNNVKKMIQSLNISTDLAKTICTGMLERFHKLNFKNNNELRKVFSQRKGGGRPGLEGPKKQSDVHKACVKDLVYQVNFNPVTKFDRINGEILDVERKVRVLETGSYAFKGGKALNINVSNQMGLGHSANYSFSAGKGIGHKDIKDIVGSIPGAGLLDKIPGSDLVESIFTAGTGLVVGDEKWTGGDSNSVSEGTSISEGTFLVMQNATVDVILKDYYQCASVTFSRKFQKALGITKLHKEGKKSEFLNLINDTLEEPISQERLFSSKDYIVDSFMHGVLICDRSEKDKATDPQYGGAKEFPIRENFYYFTQHFTEGDMLDEGDMSNHPWLKAIRGKTDMWRFLAQIRNQDLSLKSEEDDFPFDKYLTFLDSDKSKFDNFVLPSKTRGELNLGDEWPIYQLVKAYHGTIPTFPGVYSAINSPCNYGMDFPWGDYPLDSFNSEVDSIYKQQEQNIYEFNKSAFINSGVDPQSEYKGIKDTDLEISSQARKRAEEGSYMSNFLNINSDDFKNTDIVKAMKKKDYVYYSKENPIGLYYDDEKELKAQEKKIRSFRGRNGKIYEIELANAEYGSKVPSEKRIKHCPGYLVR